MNSISLLSTPSISDGLSLQETLARLKASPFVDGIAEFGSRASRQTDAVSDYDLLLLVHDVPTRVFQMVTTIDGHIADIVLVETQTADALLAVNEPPDARSFEGLFAGKMKTAHIVYDKTGRLGRVQAYVNREAWTGHTHSQPPAADLYGAWFWQSFGLLHLERMAESPSPIHQTAVDMMLTAFLPGTWRSYFEIRGIAWEGEKAAVRYWIEQDTAYLELVNGCLAANEQKIRFAAYQTLVEQTLKPVGSIFRKGATAVALANPTDMAVDVQRTLDYWKGLFDVSRQPFPGK